ncbi:MAG: SDR family oxidoreductase [Sandaracinaceae bacterium]|nr:SDR family oxidoreductase [Sandaracinaceae bacterium]
MRILVTGSTGWIGRHLLPRLLEWDAETFVLVRTAGAEVPDHPRVRRLIGDVAEPGLGLSDADREALEPSSLDHVFHLAAIYDLEADPTRLERVNVGGTQNLITLLGDGFEGVLHHVSSIAVAGDFDRRFGEDDLDRRQGFGSAYHRTKHASEKLVRASGLRFRVYRPSAVVGHSVTGAMPRLDGAYYLFRAVHKLRGVLPPWVTLPGYDPGRINMVPVDFVADAIAAIAAQDGLDGKGFHVVDPAPPRFFETFNLIADAAGGPRMGKWRPSALAKLVPGVGNVAGQLGSLRFMRREWAADLGVPAAVVDAMNPHVEYDTTHLEAALEGTGVSCPPQSAYVERLFDHYVRHLDPERDKPSRNRALFGGQRALITGGSSGVGEALARQLAAAGAHVVIVARREAELREVVAAIRASGGRADFVVADLSEMSECDRVVAEVHAAHGPIDLLFNNAGRSIRRPLAESLERFHDLERTMQINFFAPARLIRAVLPTMRERGGHIVNVLTAGAHMPSIKFGAYTSSKAALSQLGDVLAAEHLHEGIRVTNAYLHWVRTPMMGATGAYDDVPAASPDEAAASILDGMANRQQHVIRGEDQRRHTLARLHPAGLSRIMNLLSRIYADDPDAHPEVALDRTILKRFVKGRLV